MRSRSSFNRVPTCAFMTSLLVLAFTVGCDKKSPLAPTPLLPAALTVTGISPSSGSTAGTTSVMIRGTGFLPGATLTLDVTATAVTVLNSTTIAASVPAHPAGSVDVVVTNPGGQTSRLVGAFTYAVDQPYAVTPSANTVVTGGPLSVSWTAPSGTIWDWIGFFPVGDPSTNYEQHWWRYTDGAISGTFTLSAPTQRGQYEFRYLLDDGFVETVRSGPVAVR